MPAELIELQQADLHTLWPFLERGLIDVHRKLKTGWLPEDIYAALRSQQVNCVLARRAGHYLGFLIYNKQIRAFNFIPELFVWCAWSRPLREQSANDEIPLVVQEVWQYLINVAKTQYGTNEISWNTRPGRAKAFARKFGWQPSWVTMTAKV